MSQQINLLNPQLFVRKDWLNAHALVGLSVAAVMLMAALFAWTDYRVAKLDREHQVLAVQLSTVKSRLDVAVQAHAPRPPSKGLIDEIARAEATLMSRREIIAFLEGDGIGNHDGFSGYMEAFARQNLTGLWLSSFVIDDAAHRIGIEGHALQPELVPRYIAALGQEPLLSGREFAALEMDAHQASADNVVADKEKRSASVPAIGFKLQSVSGPKATEVPLATGAPR